jgi:hypothetical protein
LVTLILPLMAASAPAPRAGGEPGVPSAAVSQDELRSIDRDDAAAEKAAASGDVEAALKYFEYFGHEQERFARATVEYRRARHALAEVVTDKLGEDTWRRTAASLGVARHGRRDREPAVRREGRVVYVKHGGARHETPYVLSDGAWKVSVRDVLLLALRARFGVGLTYEEADLHVLAGKMGDVLERRSKRIRTVADSVRTGKIRSRAELEAAVESIKEGGT